MDKMGLALAGAALLAGCSPETPPATGNAAEKSAGQATGQRGARPSPSEAAGVPQLARLRDSREGDAAALHGTLGVSGRCIFVQAGGERVLIASTVPGARWDTGEGALIVDGERLRPGTQLFLGGSFAPTANLAGQWVVAPAKECVTSRAWIASGITAR